MGLTADEIRSNMHARRIDMGDGRYLIYYTFDGQAEKDEETGEGEKRRRGARRHGDAETRRRETGRCGDQKVKR